jgi:NAD(P)-dependent dehydrogenase (short-subunit alcohol dehydrogenase family)
MGPDLFSVKDKIVVITGGQGQLGRQFSSALVEKGARVAVLDILAPKEKVTPQSDPVGCTDKMLTLQADIVKRQSISEALGRINTVWGIPDALINNAALDSPPDAPSEENGPFETYPESSWDRVMEVNVKGMFLCCQVIGGQMAAAGRGVIVNICSIYGLVSPDQRIYEYRRNAENRFFKPVAYSASKSAVLNLTRYLATYWAGQNVRVNTLSFGGVYNGQDPEFLKGYCSRVPLGRMAKEEEYNGALIFLIAEASSYMTGANLVIDGGWTAW